MIQLDVKEIKALLAEILGQRLSVWLLRLLAILVFIWALKTIYEWTWPVISAVVGGLSGFGDVTAQLSPAISLVVSFLVAFGVIYGTRLATTRLAERIARTGETADLLGGRVDAVVRLIELLKDMADKNADEIQKLNASATELHEKVGQEVESVSTHLVNYGENLQVQQAVLDLISDLAGRIYAIEKQLNTTTPPAALPAPSGSGSAPKPDAP